MNAPHSASPLASVPMAPADPILGVTEAFVADQNPKKVNLGVGVYTDDNGKIPLLECVRRAEEQRMKTSPHRGYLPIDGLADYDKAVQELVFGSLQKSIVTVQAIGGTGGLKIGADFLKQLSANAQVWISEPSWENHRQLFEAAGFTVKSYCYYDPKTKGLDFAGMQRGLKADALPRHPFGAPGRLPDRQPCERFVDGAPVDTPKVRLELVLVVRASEVLSWRRVKATEVARVPTIAAAKIVRRPFEHDHACARAARRDRRAQRRVAAADDCNVVSRFVCHSE